MSADKVGIALEATVVRAVTRTRQRIDAIEITWDSTRPDIAVAQLRERIGDVRAISISVGLGFLAIAKPGLPPLTGDAARRVLSRDADRHFPIEGRVAIAAGGDSEFAFGTQSAMLQAWLTAFRAWAPVVSVHAAPHAIVCALQASHASGVDVTKSFVVDAGERERGLLSVTNGRIREVRRLPETLAAATLNGARPIPDAALKSVEGRFAAAVGAIDLANDSLDLMLLDAPLEHALVRQRQMRLLRSVALFAVSLLVLVWAANMQRDKALDSVQQSIRALDTDAAPAYAAQARLARANAELTLLSHAQNGDGDALNTLALISRALPPSTVLQRAEWNGVEWRIDGSTDNASEVVPKLDAVSAFGDVHALGASTRFRDGDRMRESFSVAFTLKGAAHAKQ